MATKELIIVAGPNGAGKSTFVAGFLADRPCPYLSADLIATQLLIAEPASLQFAAGEEFLSARKHILRQKRTSSLRLHYPEEHGRIIWSKLARAVSR